MKKRNSLMSVVVLMLVVILAIGSSSESDTPVKVEGNKAEEDDVVSGTGSDVKEEEKAADSVFQMGDTVQMGDLDFTLNSARFDGGSQYMKPAEDEKWLVFDCTIVNNGTESESMSSLLMFTVNDSEYYSKDMAFGPETKGSLDGEVGAGRTLRGEVAYSVGASETEWEFIFEPNVFGQGQAIYKVGIAEVQ